MGKILEGVVSFYAASEKSDDLDDAALFAAQKQLEGDIKQEIKAECVDEILRECNRDRDSKTKNDEVDALSSEFRLIVFQCALIAIPIGLLVNHAYDLIKGYLYSPDPSFNYLAAWVGLAVFLLVCVASIGYLLFSRVNDVVNRLIDSKRGDTGE